jgi:ethanolamine utilization protein EutN
MYLARVEGSVVATRKHPSLQGWRLVICQPIGAAGEAEGPPQIAIDAHGAGMHQRVIISSDGAAARLAVGHAQPGPLDGRRHRRRKGTGGAGMKLGAVIGRVTLSKTVPALIGARWLIVSPFTREHYQQGADTPPG